MKEAGISAQKWKADERQEEGESETWHKLEAQDGKPTKPNHNRSTDEMPVIPMELCRSGEKPRN
jgi:hypothetical protein